MDATPKPVAPALIAGSVEPVACPHTPRQLFEDRGCSFLIGALFGALIVWAVLSRESV
jgi:hypothetical protein